MPIRSYEEALQFWFSRTNYEQLGMPQDLRTLKLDRMRLLLDHLDKPQDRFPIVHVAGTKGKGSTSAMLAAMLQAAGLRTGLFTSPHLTRVERVQINGHPIDAENLTQAMQAVEQAVHQVEASGESPVTFFEVVTAIGLLHFARQQVDVAVLEVGLGGRFDATNVCTPAVAVITNISFDHMEQLGHALAAIAGEKAGIIKPGRPVVSGVTAPDARTIIRQVTREHGAPLFELERDFQFEYEFGDVVLDRWPRVRFRESERASTDWFDLHLWGEHQAANSALAWKTQQLLREQDLAVTDAAVATGLRAVQWPGRLEIMGRRPWVVLDCAHNDASFITLVNWLNSAIPARRRLLILALSRDKDLANLAPLLRPHFAEAWMTRYSSSSRGADPQLLAELWRSSGGGPVQVTPSPRDAWHGARHAASAEDLICVTGSVFLAGELREIIRAQG